MEFKKVSQFCFSMMMASAVASPAFAAEPESNASSLSTYAEKLEKKAVEIPQISWAKIESPSELAKVRLQSYRQAPVAFDSARDAQLVDGRIVDGESVLQVEQDGKTFFLHTSRWSHVQAATAGLMRAMGLEGPQSRYESSVRLRLGRYKVQDLAKIFAESKDLRPWDQIVSRETQETSGAVLTLRKVLISSPADQKRNWDWQASGDETARRALFTAFAQCGNILSQKNLKLSMCLGNTPFIATPNAFPNRMLDIQQASWWSNGTSVQFRMAYQDPLASAALSKVSKEQVAEFLARSFVLTEDSLRAVFEASGYPTSLARFYALKLLSRRDSLAELFGSSPVQQNKVSEYSDLPYIKDGIIVENWPEFEADLTKTALDMLFFELSGKALRNIDNLGREMLATLPFIDLEGGEIGKFHYSAGMIFRMKRTIKENPEPQGVSDLYLATDHLDVGVTLGGGMDFNLKINIWSTLGGGYFRQYSRVVGYPTKEAARGSHWHIPYELIAKQDYASLKKGETFALQQGFMQMLGAGSTLGKGSQYIRPSGYLMGLNSNLSFLQVTRNSNDELIVLTGPNHSYGVQSKGFWRIYNKFFRLSFASFNLFWGSKDVKKYRVRMNEHEEFSPTRMAFQNLLATGSAKSLATVVPSEVYKVKYRDRSWRYNFYYLSQVSGKSFADYYPDLAKFSEEAPPEIQKFSLIQLGSGFGSRLGGNGLKDQRCHLVTAMAFKKADSKVPDDNGTEIRCDFNSEKTRIENWKKDLEVLKSSFAISEEQEKLVNEVMGTISAQDPATLSIRIRMGSQKVQSNDQLQQLVEGLYSRLLQGEASQKAFAALTNVQTTVSVKTASGRSLSLAKRKSNFGEAVLAGPALKFIEDQDRAGETLVFDGL